MKGMQCMHIAIRHAQIKILLRSYSLHVTCTVTKYYVTMTIQTIVTIDCTLYIHDNHISLHSTIVDSHSSHKGEPNTSN